MARSMVPGHVTLAALAFSELLLDLLPELLLGGDDLLPRGEELGESAAVGLGALRVRLKCWDVVVGGVVEGGFRGQRVEAVRGEDVHGVLCGRRCPPGHFRGDLLEGREFLVVVVEVDFDRLGEAVHGG